MITAMLSYRFPKVISNVTGSGEGQSYLLGRLGQLCQKDVRHFFPLPLSFYGYFDWMYVLYYMHASSCID